ncbi:MAG: hypothetical protein JXA97_06335 [Anaerolineales bacterium]|nr:hypothetical protein [Anaerolineales bacterium]
MPRRDFFTFLLYASRARYLGRLAYYLLKFHGTEIPQAVQIGSGVTLEHGGACVVIHRNSTIGNRVKIYPGVTLGRADVYRPIGESAFEAIFIGDDVVLGSGAKVLGKEGILSVGSGTVIGANAVLLTSTGENEIWSGIPAHRVGMRVEPDKGTD